MTDIIFPDDPRSATYRTDICGWVSRDGRFFGEGPQVEELARAAGATHVHCNSCGAPVESRRYYRLCALCKIRQEAARFLDMPEAEWDGKAMLYSQTLDRYYTDMDAVHDELDEGGALTDLQLVICEPIYARQLASDFFEDQLPDDPYIDPPPDLEDAIEAFNKAVEGLILSWEPGKKRLRIEP